MLEILGFFRDILGESIKIDPKSSLKSHAGSVNRLQFCVTVSDCIQKMHLYHRKTDLITASLCRKLHRYILPIGINYQYGVFPQ